MQRLPIPPLSQTLERFTQGIAPLLCEKDINKTKQLADDFETQCGEQLQQRLLDYADKQAEQGLSWLTKIKLDAYLGDTRPLAITNNASLQLDYSVTENIQAGEDDSHPNPTYRAASFIQRMVRTHINYLNDAIPQPVDPRGQPISMYNWRILAGAVREPSPDGDYYYYAPKQTKNRNISVLWQGHQIALQVTDSEGNVYSVAAIQKALNNIMQTQYDATNFDFAAISALGSQKTADYLEILCQNNPNQQHNQQCYDAIRDSLFSFSPYHSGADDVSQIHEQTFMPGKAWQFKPMNYQMDLDSDFLAIHFEHSEIDGAALRHMFVYAFNLELTQDSNEKTPAAPTTQLLDWKCDKKTASQIKQDIDQVAAQAHQLKVQQCTADYTAITTKVSHDAMMQLALLYAQIKVFDKVRNTYEAVDTSQFMAGRTEALRPNSTEAIALCEALIANNASKEQLTEALAAHKQRVIASKTGQAFDRHLTALKEMVSENDNESFKACVDAFYNSPGYMALTGGDFLSTSSMGNQSPVKRILFAPVMAGGFGVNYSMSDTHYEFVLFADATSGEYIDDMCQACVEGVEKLIGVLGG